MRKVGAVFQAVAFLVGLTLLSGFFYIRFQTFLAHDPIELIHKNSPSEKTVTTGVHITNFIEFNVIKNNFVLEGTVWFAFDPKVVSLDIIKKFNIAHGQILHRYDPVVQHDENLMLAQFDVRIQFTSSLMYRLFPIDDHRITLTIMNRYLPEGVIFSSSKSDITISPDIYVPGWKITDYQVNAGYQQIDLMRGKTQYGVKHETVQIVLECDRIDPNIISNVLLTLILILFMSLLTYSSTEDSVLVVSVIIVALIGYRAVMQQSEPSHISYFMLSDYLYLITLTTTILALLGGIYSTAYKLTLYEKKLIIGAIYALFVGACIVMTLIL